MTPTFIALLDDPVALTLWAAGFFDGEGSINITNQVQQSTGRMYHALCLSTAQVSREPLDVLAARWGGTVVSRVPGPTARPNTQLSFAWQVRSQQAENFLRDIQPYAIVKARDIEIALRFREIKATRGGVTGQGRGTPRQQDVHDAREALRLELLERRVR
jgi:hypothetical protein